MTKAEVISEISQQTGLDKTEVLVTLEAFVSVIKTAVAEGDNVYIRGFGSFIVKRRKAKLGRLIAKKTSVTIPPHNVPLFKPAKQFIEKVKTADSPIKQSAIAEEA